MVIALQLLFGLKTRRDVVWALCNITDHGTFDHTCKLVDQGFILLVVSYLNDNEDAKLLARMLKAIQDVLTWGVKLIEQRGSNLFLDLFDSCQGSQKVEKLQQHQSNAVYENALEILETFYDLADV